MHVWLAGHKLCKELLKICYRGHHLYLCVLCQAFLCTLLAITMGTVYLCVLCQAFLFIPLVVAMVTLCICVYLNYIFHICQAFLCTPLAGDLTLTK